MPATFADISWGSDTTDAIAQIRKKGFIVLDKVSTMVRAEGEIFGKDSRVFLKFDQAGLHEIAVFMDVTVARAVTEYDKLFLILSQKYGATVFENANGSIWCDAESTGGTEIMLTLTDDYKELGIIYQSPKQTVSEINKYKENQEASKDLF